MKLTRFIFINILLTAYTALVEAKTDCIWIKHTNNSQSCVMLDTNPEFQFEDESIIIDSKYYVIDDIVSYRFGDSEIASIGDISDDTPYIVFRDHQIEVRFNKDTNENQAYSIIDLKGIIIKNILTTYNDGIAILDIEDLSPGIYFLHTHRSSLKFIKK